MGHRLNVLLGALPAVNRCPGFLQLPSGILVHTLSQKVCASYHSYHGYRGVVKP